MHSFRRGSVALPALALLPLMAACSGGEAPDPRGDGGGARDMGTPPPADAPTPPMGCRADSDCDDRDPCTTNLCDPATGACGFRPMEGCCTGSAQCDDSDRCTNDGCTIATNTCTHTRVAGCCTADTDCNDGNPCTRDSCDAMTNRCTTAPVSECCMDGATRDCFTGPAAAAGVGVCRGGRQTCVGNRWEGQPCVDEVLPAATEACDAARLDENCNGTANEDCTCTAGATRSCYTGPAGTAGVARCRAGTQSCAGGTWGACSGEVLPAREVCGNSVDEDCNGSDLACPPLNDNRAMAIPLEVRHSETVAMGTTTGATHDGPATSCSCTSGGNVWYRFTLTTDSAVYIDTASTTPGPDTSLFLTDNAGALVPGQPANGQPNPGLCNDDSGCGGVAGWGSTLQSRTWGFLAAGTYFIAVGGCSAGNFTLRLQHIPITEGSYFYNTRIAGDGNDTTYLIGTNRHVGTCGGRISGEDVRWFVTCGASQFFSLCEGDGGGYLSRATSTEATRWDPILYVHSGITGLESACADTGATGVDCRGRIGTSIATGTLDTVQGGARFGSVPASRGVNAIVVDERMRGSGMDYRLRWRITDR